MRIKKYLILYNAEIEDELSTEEFNFIYGEDSIFSKKSEALINAKDLTEIFNKKFNKEYKWNDLYSIEIAYYNESGERLDD